MTLRQGLEWVLQGGGAGVLTYLAMEYVPLFKRVRAAKWRRVLAWVLAMGLGTGAWALSLWMGFVPVPVSPQETVGTLFGVWFASVTTSQAFHGFTRLGDR